MKNDRNPLAFLLLVPLSLAFLARGDGLSFHPAEGASLTKTFTLESELSLDEMSVSVNGQDIDPEQFGGMEMTTSVKQVIAVTDQYLSLGEGRPSRLKRTFDELSSTTQVSLNNAMMGNQDETLTGKSDLEGLAVEFTWNEDQGEYAVAFAEGSKGKEELLEGLAEDTDLRGFLPEGEVKEGATWSVDVQLLRHVLAPSGAVKIEPENVSEMMGMQGPQPSMDEMLGEFEGNVTAEYAGTREEDGVRVAIVKLKVEVTSAKDATELMQENMEEMELPPEVEMSVDSLDIEYGFEGEGELHWNLGTGLLHSMSLSGEASMTIDTSMKLHAQGMDQAIENSMTLSGNQSVSVTSD